MTASKRDTNAIAENLILAGLRLKRRDVTGVRRMSALEYFHGARFVDANRGLIDLEPWPHLEELIGDWGEGKSGVVLKARQIGVSWAVATYVAWVAQRPGSMSILLSQGQFESFELLRKVRAILINHRNPSELSTDAKGEIEVLGGGRVVALPSTMNAGRGFTATLVVADEAAYHPYGEDNYAAYRPSLDGGGQFIAVSTANGAIGWFAELYWDAVRGSNGYNHWFYPWNVRPGRDAAWLEAERRSFKGVPAVFKQEYPNTPEEAFISLTGLVYPQFSELRHVIRSTVGWADCKWRVAGIDFGGGDPTAVIPLGISAGEHVHQYGEFYKIGPVGVTEIAEYLHRLHRYAPFDAILADPTQGVAIESLRSLGLPVWPADNRRPEGLGNIGWLLDENRLTIDPDCYHSIGEFRGYRWRVSTDPNSKDRYATSTPVDHHADAMDARRYAIMHIVRSIQADHQGGPLQVVYA